MSDVGVRGAKWLGPGPKTLSNPNCQLGTGSNLWVSAWIGEGYAVTGGWSALGRPLYWQVNGTMRPHPAEAMATALGWTCDPSTSSACKPSESLAPSPPPRRSPTNSSASCLQLLWGSVAKSWLRRHRTQRQGENSQVEASPVRARRAASRSASARAPPRLQVMSAMTPMMICGTNEAARHTRSAAVAAPESTPSAVRSAIIVASTVPRPPGVIGIIRPIWATANEPNATSNDVLAEPQPSTPRSAT